MSCTSSYNEPLVPGYPLPSGREFEAPNTIGVYMIIPNTGIRYNFMKRTK